MSALFRFRTWLADHSRAQYPRQEFIPRDTPPAPARWPLRWRYQMQALVRFNLALVAIFCIIVFGTLALVLIYLFGLFAWAAWTS